MSGPNRGSHARKCTEAQVAAIRAAYRSGMPYRDIQNQIHNVSMTQLSAIALGRNYAWLPDAVQPHEVRKGRGDLTRAQ